LWVEFGKDDGGSSSSKLLRNAEADAASGTRYDGDSSR
jgi:hypothetical protein